MRFTLDAWGWLRVGPPPARSRRSCVRYGVLFLEGMGTLTVAIQCGEGTFYLMQGIFQVPPNKCVEGTGRCEMAYHWFYYWGITSVREGWSVRKGRGLVNCLTFYLVWNLGDIQFVPIFWGVEIFWWRGWWSKNGGTGGALHCKEKVEKEIIPGLNSQSLPLPGSRGKGEALRGGLLQCSDVPSSASYLWVAPLTHPFLIKAVRDLSPEHLARQLKLD